MAAMPSFRFVRELAAWRPGRYARDSLLTFAWLAARALVQVVMVLLLARWLGAAEYGRFVAALAVIGFVVPLAGTGLAGVLLRDIARNPAAADILTAQVFSIWVPLALGLATVAALLSWLVLPHPLSLPALLCLAWGEVLGSSAAELVARVEQARHRLGRFAFWLFAPVAARLLALLAYGGTARPSAEGWALVYGLVSLLAVAPILASRRSRRSISSPALLSAAWPFAVGALAARLAAEFNKPLLAHVGYAQAAHFNIAQRAADLAALPLAALEEALWPRVYAASQPTRRLLVTGGLIVMLALAGGVLLVLVAPCLPRLLGAEYGPVSETLVWLAGLPAVQVVRNLATGRLIAEGKSRLVARSSLLGAGANIAATMLLVGPAGVFGAVVALYVGDVVVIVSQFLAARAAGRP